MSKSKKQFLHNQKKIKRQSKAIRENKKIDLFNDFLRSHFKI